MLRRHAAAALRTALADTPVVLLNGARQTGKSTLARWIASGAPASRYLTLDDAGVQAAAQRSPAGFLGGLGGLTVLDEVQRAPDLFLAIKAVVDRQPRPGRFLLTGSADILLLPRLSESLAGRMEIVTLWPFSQGELAGVQENFIDTVFSRKPPAVPARRESRSKLLNKLLQGGYPSMLVRAAEERRRAWFGAYVTTILQRDVRDMANIEGLTDLPRLLSLVASRAGGLLNFADLSRNIGIPQTTLKRYMTLWEATFLVQLLPAWSTNLGRRMVKAPKLYLNDTGIACYLLGLNKERLAGHDMLLGPLFENFVVMELRKQALWSRTRPQMFHFRTQTGQEVDIVLEDPAGDIVGIEVKARVTPAAGDFKGLRALAEMARKRFRRGVVLYTGAEPIPFGHNLYALPMTALWTQA